MAQAVLSALEDGVRIITLNRPDRMNAMNEALIIELYTALKEAQADPATQVIILHGAGAAFCTGDDLRQNRDMLDVSQTMLEDRIRILQGVSREIMFGDKLVIAAVHGWAVGGGFEWAINCDLSVWTTSAKAFFPEVCWGMFVTGGITALLPRLIGAQRARELILFGEHLSAPYLHQLGIVNRVVDDGSHLSEARAMAHKIKSMPAYAAQGLKKAINAPDRAAIEAAMELETSVLASCLKQPETLERIKRYKTEGEK